MIALVLHKLLTYFCLTGGMGIGATTKKVLTHPDFLKEPKACATEVWEASRYGQCSTEVFYVALTVYDHVHTSGNSHLLSVRRK